jgi:hypothetical protein
MPLTKLDTTAALIVIDLQKGIRGNRGGFVPMRTL